MKIAMLFIINCAYAIDDQNSVLKMPKTGLIKMDQPAVEFILIKDVIFEAGSHQVDLATASSIGQCSIQLSVLNDHSNERIMRAGKKMKLAITQCVNDTNTSGYIFYVSFFKTNGQRDFLSIICSVPTEQFKNYSYGQLKRT